MKLFEKLLFFPFIVLRVQFDIFSIRFKTGRTGANWVYRFFPPYLIYLITIDAYFLHKTFINALFCLETIQGVYMVNVGAKVRLDRLHF